MCQTCKTPSPGNWSLVASGADYWPAEALTAALEMPSERDMAVHGYLLTEGTPTGDRRLIENGALTWELPVPLMRVVENRGGHDGQFTVGAITEMEREEDGRIRWAGRLFNTEAGIAAYNEMKTRYNEAGLKYGLSADLDDAEVDVEFAESEDGLIEVKMQTLKSGRVRGATLCDIPAFIDAFAVLDEDDNSGVDSDYDNAVRAEGLAASSENRELLVVDGSQRGPEGERVRSVRTTPGASIDLGVGDQAAFDGRGHAGPSVQEHTVCESRTFGGVLTRGELPKTVGDSGANGGLQAGAPVDRGNHQMADRDEPLREAVSGAKLSTVCECKTTSLRAAAFGGDRGVSGDAVGSGAALTAAALRSAPTSWFLNPRLSGPTPLTVTAEGRVYGHIALWSTCHTGFSGVCVQPPRSRSGYAYFRTGLVITADGDQIPVGHLTMDTGHASPRLGARDTVAHYDHTGSVVCDLAAGEDDYGIWVAGSVRDIGGDKIRELQAAAVSGDWREINGSLELVALLSVPVPGFPVPRATALAASGSMKSLIATAGVLEAHVEEVVEEAIEETPAEELVAEETPVEIANEAEADPEEDAENEGAPAQEEPAEEEAVTEEELPELLPAVESPVDVTDLLKNLDNLVGPDPRVIRQLEQLDKLAGA